MNRFKAAVGLCTLCALALGVFATEGALATKGTTGFTCKEVTAGTGHFKASHCKASDAGTGAGANWDHVAIAESTKTEFELANTTTVGGRQSFIVKTSPMGMTIALTAQQVNGTGILENLKDAATGEHYLSGIVSLTLSEVTTEKCEVFSNNGGKLGELGVIKFESLALTSKGQGDAVKLSPVEGAAIAKFWLKCAGGTSGVTEGEPLTITGSVNGTLDGATLNFVHTQTTEQSSLKFGGSKVGFEGSLTLKTRANSGEAFKGVSPTTVETP